MLATSFDAIYQYVRARNAADDEASTIRRSLAAGQGGAGGRGRGVIENKHSTDVESIKKRNRAICKGQCGCSYDGYTGARAKAWCLLEHAEASDSHAYNGLGFGRPPNRVHASVCALTSEVSHAPISIERLFSTTLLPGADDGRGRVWRWRGAEREWGEGYAHAANTVGHGQDMTVTDPGESKRELTRFL